MQTQHRRRPGPLTDHKGTLYWPVCSALSVIRCSPLLLVRMSEDSPAASSQTTYYTLFCTLSDIFYQSLNSPADVALVLPHAEVPLHVVPGVPQLSSGKVADLTHEGFGACRAKCAYSPSARVWVWRGSNLVKTIKTRNQNLLGTKEYQDQEKTKTFCLWDQYFMSKTFLF